MVETSALITKADLALSELTSSNGLKPDDVEDWIEVAVNPTELLKRIVVETTGSPTKRLPNYRFGSAILKKAVSGAALPSGSRSKPTFSAGIAAPVLMRAEVVIPDEIGEDNVSSEQIFEKLRNAAMSRVGTDLENVTLNGVTTSSDDLLKSFNGLRAEITTNTLAVSPIAYLTAEELKNTHLALPTAFSGDNGLVFFTSRRARQQYRDSLGSRATPLGDDVAFSASKRNLYFDGMEVIALPDMPENLLGAGASNETVVLHLNPMGVHLVFHREITVKTQEDISAGNAKMVISLRADQAMEYEGATEQTTGIQVSA